MKVVIDARMIMPEMTGVGRYLMGLASGLRDHSDGFLIEMWLQPGLPVDHPVWRLAGDHLSLHVLPIAHMDLRQHWIVPAELRGRQPDLLHHPHFDLPWRIPVPAVATLHDLKYIARPDFFPSFGRVKRLLMLTMMLATVNRAKRVIADSESTRQDIVNYLRVSPNKVYVIPLGVDHKNLGTITPPQVEAFTLRYGFHKPMILYVGERRPHKNIPGLIRAFLALRRSGDYPHHLVIAGKPYVDYQAPEHLVQNLGLSNCVHFIENIPDHDLACLYHAAHVFVLPSFYEGFGLPVLEAMACGTPVVASNTTSLPEVVGDAGILVDPANPHQIAQAVSLLLTPGEQRDSYIQRGLARANQFTWERCAAETLALYREVLNV